MITMRRILASLTALAALAVMVTAPAASASSMDRDWVPDNALTGFRSVAFANADPAAEAVRLGLVPAPQI